jgi:hypothetical protein
MFCQNNKNVFRINVDAIDKMKSMTIYDFRVGSRLDMRSLKILNFTCSDIRLNYEIID